MTILTASRYHDISCGHRVVGHEGKCRGMHGHNYRVHFECVGDPGNTLDALGRVIDFGVIKSQLCMWLENQWDHKFLLWHQDPLVRLLAEVKYPDNMTTDDFDLIIDSFHEVEFNPTAENMAEYLLNDIAPQQLLGTGVRCCKVTIEETRKCSATAQFPKSEEMCDVR